MAQPSPHAWITPRLPVISTLAPVAWCHRCGALRSDARDLVTRAVLLGFPVAGGVPERYRYLAPAPMAELGAWSDREPACR